tara:strand:+ start:747 stop:920 length:174 start_codon:yes stop_codon:yes gene_type:complete
MILSPHRITIVTVLSDTADDLTVFFYHFYVPHFISAGQAATPGKTDHSQPKPSVSDQ